MKRKASGTKVKRRQESCGTKVKRRKESGTEVETEVPQRSKQKSSGAKKVEEKSAKRVEQKSKQKVKRRKKSCGTKSQAAQQTEQKPSGAKKVWQTGGWLMGLSGGSGIDQVAGCSGGSVVEGSTRWPRDRPGGRGLLGKVVEKSWPEVVEKSWPEMVEKPRPRFGEVFAAFLERFWRPFGGLQRWSRNRDHRAGGVAGGCLGSGLWWLPCRLRSWWSIGACGLAAFCLLGRVVKNVASQALDPGIESRRSTKSAAKWTATGTPGAGSGAAASNAKREGDARSAVQS